jgi:NADP-dependent 3-hydroxy acid dehydrogenase YdfG
VADITDNAQAVDAVERLVSEYGQLDIVVNNAGLMLLGPMEDAPVEEWDRMIDLNLKALLYTTQASLPHLLRASRESPRGIADLVNVSSLAGRIARAGAGVYNLTKHGVGAVSEALRQEVSGRGVRVTIIEPGFVDTELTGHIRPGIREKERERISQATPLLPEDIAESIEFAVTRHARVSLNEILVRPTTQP